MVLLTDHLSLAKRRTMPVLKQSSALSEEDLTDVEDLSSQSNNSLCSSKWKDSFNHPNAVSAPIVGQKKEVLVCFDNEAFEHDEVETAATEQRLKGKETSKNITDIETIIDTEMSGEGKIQNLEQPSTQEQEEQWLEAERSAFISRKIQSIVQAFQYRTEKAKEKLVQPPTPSPSPPLETSSENDQPSPIHESRLRLQSLIEEEKSSLDSWSQNISFYCCVIKKTLIPTFPKIIDPQSKLYIMWLFLVMTSYAYNSWSIILRAVFPYQTPENLPIFLSFDYIADIIYLLDIAVFKVRLQFLHNGFWVENYKMTKANYFRKREFKLDLLSLLPLDLLYFIYGTNPLFRLPRFFKVQTFWEFFNRVDAVTKTPYVIRIIRTLMYMMYLIHLNACAYYAMSTWEGIGSNRWVFQGAGNAYIRCFYFATKTATSIGKNPKPENEIEYIFMTISWLMGVFIFAFLVGQIRDIVATATQSRTQYRQLMDQTVMYMRNLNLPDELQRRVRMWLNHNWEQQKTFNVGRILDTLPRKMKTDVAINVHFKTLVKVQLFKDCDKALLRDLVLQLRPVLFLPGDYICKKGEVGKEMYIVNKGIVEVLGGEKSELVLATLTKGSVFGEISLLGIPGCNRRTADVRSKGFSNLFVLGKDDLWEALKNYPEAQKVLKKKAKNIIKENEARAQTTQVGRESTAAIRNLVGQGEEPPYTPKLVRTVMQVLPKSCHRVQPHYSATSKSSFTNIPAEESSHNWNSNESIGNNPSTSKVESFRNRKVSASPPVVKSSRVLQPRSLSDSTLRKQPKAHEKLNVNKSLDFPFIVKKISPTKSEPCSYHQLNTNKEGRCNSIAAMFSALSKTPLSSHAEKLHTHPSDIVECANIASETQKQILPEDLPMIFQKVESTEVSSEESSITTEKMIIDNSEGDTNSQSSNLSSSSSSVPFLGGLFHRKSSQSLASTNNLTPIDVHENIDRVAFFKIPMPSCEKKVLNSPSSSSSSSVLYLGGLFHNSSSQSSNSSNKDFSISPTSNHAMRDLESPSNDSSSCGYDNLAFVPTGLFSRRSSIFSDVSG